MNTRLLSAALLCSILYFIATPIKAQEFMRINHSAGTGSYYNDVAVLTNGNYVCTGRQTISVGSPNVEQMVVTIFSPEGKQLKQFNSHGNYDEGLQVIATTDGGFAIAGVLNIGSPGGSAKNPDRFMFVRYNSSGDTLWRKIYTPTTGTAYEAHDLIQLPDNGFVVVGSTFDTILPDRDAFIIRTDSIGDTVWTYQMGKTTWAENARSVTMTRDGNLFITGRVDTSGFSTAKNGFAMKLDMNGNRLWYKEYKHFGIGAELKGIETDNGYVLMHNNLLIVLNSQGDSITKFEPDSATVYSRLIDDIARNADGTFVITGKRNDSINFGLWIMKLSPQLDSLWYKTYRATGVSGRGRSILPTADKGYVVAGGWGTSYSLPVILKTDSLGNIAYSEVMGKVVSDANVNCSADSTEALINGNLVTVTTTEGMYIALTDAQGNYWLQVYDTGQVQIQSHPKNSYWTIASCQAAGTTATLLFGDTAEVDFFMDPVVLCPKLRVHVSNPALLRACRGGFGYYVTYANEGTIPATNAYIDIEFDPSLHVDSSSLAWAQPQSGNIYRFELGDIPVSGSGSFRVRVSVDCGAVLGQIHCVEAHIYPDTLCDALDSTWDLSSLRLTSECLPGDTIKFELTNQGTGNMAAPMQYTIVANSTLHSQQQFQLTAGASLTELIPGNGNTYTMIVPQSPGHPGFSAPIQVVEGCGTNNGFFSTGYAQQFPYDDQDLFVDITCQTTVGSFDPNDKRVEPLGLGAEGFINATQQLDYTIRFQNTGTDTAFLVILRDTLPQYLDASTLQLTAASHSYTFAVLDSNVLEWTFDNILLPDSNVNEPESHGYVSFHIQQTAGNIPGTEIRNRAGIYFDFNAPVITNYTLNTIVEDYINELTISIEELEGDGNMLKVYPNPNTGQFNIELQQPVDGNMEFVVYDLAGKQMLSSSFNGTSPHAVNLAHLETGMYLYQLSQNGVMVSKGKVLISK